MSGVMELQGKIVLYKKRQSDNQIERQKEGQTEKKVNTKISKNKRMCQKPKKNMKLSLISYIFEL